MWTIENPSSGTTNIVTVPADGIISIIKPKGVKVEAYINSVPTGIHHLHVKTGDSVHFDIKSQAIAPTTVAIEYAGVTSTLAVAGAAVEMDKIKKASKPSKSKEKHMSEAVNLFATPNTGMGGAIGGGLGAGLLGGVLGGALLGGNGGGLFGNRNGMNGINGGYSDPMAAINAVNMNTDSAVGASERLTAARFDAEAQREIQAAIERTAAATQLATAVGNAALGVAVAKGQGETNTQVALTTGALGTQNALNAAAIGVQVQKTSGDLATQMATQTAALGVQTEKTATDNALAVALGQRDLTNQLFGAESRTSMTATHNFAATAAQIAENKYVLATAIKADGDLTRALINEINNDELNRRLVIAQNELIELRGDSRGRDRARETEVNVTQVVNQNQAQQQQQQQFQVTNDLLRSLVTHAQIAQATNQNMIIGNTGFTSTGTQTANPINVR